MRNYLKYITLGILTVVLIVSLSISILYLLFLKQGVSKRNNDIKFVNALNIPPVLTPRIENGKKIFSLNILSGTTEFFPGKKTKTLGLNGTYLGPTLRVHTGDNIAIEVKNDLKEPTTLHWHGMHVPAQMDGGPYQVIEPGKTWSPSWMVTNTASTLWYHPHLMGKTAEQVYKGLAGFFIVDDEVSDALSLPHTYGIDDIPLVVQDRQFDLNKQLVYHHNSGGFVATGMMDDTILVNGTYAPFASVPARLVRLRLLNGSNARRYNFGLSDNQTFYQIGSDGGLLSTPVAMNRLLLAPGERADILIDFLGKSEPVTLMSYAFTDEIRMPIKMIFHYLRGRDDENQEFKLLELRPVAGAYDVQKIPEQLTTISRMDSTKAVKERVFSLGNTKINNKKMDAERVDEIVKKGDLEIWKIKNDSVIYHPFHVHGVQFQILERDKKPPELNEMGWKDTVMIPPTREVKLLVQFNEYSDTSYPYMYHCHILEHEDMGMMGQFVVVDDLSQKITLPDPPVSMHMEH